MKSVSINSLQPKPLRLESKRVMNGVPSADLIGQFGDTLKKKLTEVNDLVSNADNLTKKMVTGEVENLHDVIIASEKASLAMQMATQLKVVFVKAYQQIMMIGMQ